MADAERRGGEGDNRSADARTALPMAPPAEVDLARVRTVPIARRPNKVRAEEFASPPPSGEGGEPRSFEGWLGLLAILSGLIGEPGTSRSPESIDGDAEFTWSGDGGGAR